MTPKVLGCQEANWRSGENGRWRTAELGAQVAASLNPITKQAGRPRFCGFQIANRISGRQAREEAGEPLSGS